MNERTQLIAPEWRKPVIAVPLTQAFPALGEVKEFKSKICLFNHNRTKVFDVVSDKYKVIDHGKAMDVITDAVHNYFDDPGIEPSVRSLQGGARVVATYKLPIAPIVVKKGDLTDLSFQLLNSYDRSTPFIVTLGALRLVCTNGMKMGTTFGSIKAKHVGSESEEERDEYLHSAIDTMVKSVPEIRELWRQWGDTKVEFDEAVEMLAGQFPGKYLNPVLDASRFPCSKWELYNMLTRFSSHDTKTIQRRLEFDDRIARIFYGSSHGDE